MKYALASPDDLIPIEVFDKVPGLSNNYTAIVASCHVCNDLAGSPSLEEVESAVVSLKDHFVPAFVRNQKKDYVFETQVEAYYYDKSADMWPKLAKMMSILRLSRLRWRHLRRERARGMSFVFATRKSKSLPPGVSTIKEASLVHNHKWPVTQVSMSSPRLLQKNLFPESAF